MMPSLREVTYSMRSYEFYHTNTNANWHQRPCDPRPRRATHRIRPHLSRLLQHSHHSLQVRSECAPDRKRDVSEAAQDRLLDAPVQELALKVLEERVHELVAVRGRGLAESSADVTDETDGDQAQLVLLLS